MFDIVYGPRHTPQQSFCFQLLPVLWVSRRQFGWCKTKIQQLHIRSDIWAIISLLSSVPVLDVCMLVSSQPCHIYSYSKTCMYNVHTKYLWLQQRRPGRVCFNSNQTPDSSSALTVMWLWCNCYVTVMWQIRDSYTTVMWQLYNSYVTVCELCDNYGSYEQDTTDISWNAS